MNRDTKIGAAAVLTMSVAAGAGWAHGPNVELGVSNGQVVTTHFFSGPNNDMIGDDNGENYNPYYGGQSVRLMDVPMAENTSTGTTALNGPSATNPTANGSVTSNAGWYGQPLSDGSADFTGPGIAYGADHDASGNPISNGFTASSATPLTITESLMGPLQVWNGSAFVNSTTERLEGIRGSLGATSAKPDNALFTDPEGYEAGSWSTSQTSLTPDSHNQVEWRLDVIGTEDADLSAPDGIYLATLEISSNEAATSLPFYFLFEKNASQDQIAAAQNYVNTVYVPANYVPTPEPASLGVLGVGMLALLGRRRR
ncbi:MAG TPA: PEP-CTERM sorting domain-containing protein [Phycisphaerae bacterium]|nr:PEP-CTERM sorting domain-containing protein [Phycisphaerae bacterium]